MRFPCATIHICRALGSHSTAANSGTPVNTSWQRSPQIATKTWELKNPENPYDALCAVFLTTDISRL